jgi:hypothetical protein
MALKLANLDHGPTSFGSTFMSPLRTPAASSATGMCSVSFAKPYGDPPWIPGPCTPRNAFPKIVGNVAPMRGAIDNSCNDNSHSSAPSHLQNLQVSISYFTTKVTLCSGKTFTEIAMEVGLNNMYAAQLFYAQVWCLPQGRTRGHCHLQ